MSGDRWIILATFRNANIQYMKPDFHIANTNLLQNGKKFVSVELQNGQRHTNEIIVKF